MLALLKKSGKVMRFLKIFFNVIIGSSLIVLFCCAGSNKVVLQEETKEINYIPYYLKVYEADSLYWTGNYKRSFEILDSLFEKYEPLNQLGIYEMQTYVKTAFLTRHYDVMKPTFKRLIDTWGYSTSFLEYDSIMMEAWKKTTIEQEEVASWQDNYNKKINWTLRDTLIAMHKADQLFRGKDRDKETKREDSVDLVHIELLKYIFKKYGYPEPRLVGNIMIGSEFNHISHMLDDDGYQYFKHELSRFNKQGNSTQHQLTMLIDVREYKINNRAIYGTFGTHESFGEKMIKFDTLEVNRNRRSIGLPSIQYSKFKEEIFNSMYNQ